jgi:hypothetical protein
MYIHEEIQGFISADGNAQLPDSWNPDQLEKGWTEVLSETEKAMQDRNSKS